LFRSFEIYWIDLKDSFFYDNELNFYSINKDGENIFLYCSFVNNKSLLGSLNNLKKWDTTVAYTTYADAFEIIDVKQENWKVWKKVLVTRTFKDKLWKKDVLQIQTTYFVPQNSGLKWYYDLYSLVSKLKEVNDWYRGRITNIPQATLNLNIREIYNKDWLKVQAYFIPDNEWVYYEAKDPYWISYILVNGIWFYDDYTGFKKHNIFEYLVKNNSPLTKYIVWIWDKLDENKKSQLSWDWWVRFRLWDEDFTEEVKDKVQIQPYYTREGNFIDHTFYKVYNSDIQIDKSDFANYMYNNVFTSENKENPDKLISLLKEISIEWDYEEFKELYKSGNYSATNTNSSVINNDVIKTTDDKIKSWDNLSNIFYVGILFIVIIWLLCGLYSLFRIFKKKK
jgi:hypothetical protein